MNYEFSSPQQESGYKAATIAITPVVINLRKEVIRFAEEAAKKAGMERDKWIEQQIAATMPTPPILP